jgi:adenylyltransferase/sulfurtransferase
MPNPEFPLEIDVVSAQRLHLADPTRTVIIDVREPYELEICHIEGAEPIPMRTIPARLERLPRDKHLLILCHSGGRSGRITDFLRAQGFLAVSNITGGIDAWAQALDPTMRRY